MKIVAISEGAGGRDQPVIDRQNTDTFLKILDDGDLPICIRFSANRIATCDQKLVQVMTKHSVDRDRAIVGSEVRKALKDAGFQARAKDDSVQTGEGLDAAGRSVYAKERYTDHSRHGRASLRPGPKGQESVRRVPSVRRVASVLR